MSKPIEYFIAANLTQATTSMQCHGVSVAILREGGDNDEHWEPVTIHNVYKLEFNQEKNRIDFFETKHKTYLRKQ